MTNRQSFVIVVSMIMTSVLLLGLLAARQRKGVGNIGLESALVLALYAGAALAAARL